MENLIIYKSTYGHAKKYAFWLQKILKCPMVDLIKIEGEEKIDIAKYDRIIFICGVYSLNLPIVTFIRDNYELIKNKSIYILAVGLADKDEEYLEKLKKRNRIEDFKVFYAFGGWPGEDMTITDKTAMKIMADVRGFLEKDFKYWQKIASKYKRKPVDLTSKDQLEELVNDIKNEK
ncbi:flavodoxin domain-containing protein [Peptoniphilus sp. GNH]|nr:flavodoxin domain-containing protein [Peptoniphilus sp. GNH]